MIIPTRLSTKVTNLRPVSTMSRLVDSSKRHLFPGERHLSGVGASAATFRRHKWERCSTGDGSLSRTFRLCVGSSGACVVIGAFKSFVCGPHRVHKGEREVIVRGT